MDLWTELDAYAEFYFAHPPGHFLLNPENTVINELAAIERAIEDSEY